jgi:hypothetical protein
VPLVKLTNVIRALAALILCLAAATPVLAQDSKWNIEGSIGWDIGLSGDFIAAGIGTINNVPVVIQTQSYGTVYGTGIQWQIGAGYALDDKAEVLGSFTYQRSGADAVLLGKAGTSDLYGTFDDYEVWSIEAGYRRYFERHDKLRPYAGILIGIADIPRINGIFSATSSNIVSYNQDLYDGTAAFIFTVNGGALYHVNDRADIKFQIGLRHTGGLSDVDSLQGTGLGVINDRSSRWSLPISIGLHVRF